MSGGNLLQKFMPSFSGVYLIFEGLHTGQSNKENSSVYWHAGLSCPLMALNYGNLNLVPISFWMLMISLDFLGAQEA